MSAMCRVISRCTTIRIRFGVSFAPGTSTQAFQPFPNLGGIGTIHFAGVSTYNSLQTKLEKRLSHGLTFLATYTWSHALDDSSDAGGLSTAVGDRNMALIPFIDEYTNSPYDVRNRFTLNGNYQLPLGKGRAFLNNSRWEYEIVGGWSTSLTFAAQSGTPFTISPNNSTAASGSARAVQIAPAFASGGGANCPTRTRTRDNWYNPCSFGNPFDGSTIGTRFPSPVTDEQTAIALLGGKSNTVYGPGYNGVNMSLFKNFATFREQYLQFRTDVFNLLNHPTLANPSTTNNNSNGGEITSPKTFQNNTPDARFLQLSLKYVF